MLLNSADNQLVTLHSKTPCYRNHLWDLFRLCIPLMISALSSTLMIFLDRVVLAKYDTQSMIASTVASNACYVFQNGAISIAMIVAIFVGQFNGAKLYTQIGNAVWQMIWFSGFCAFVMFLLGIYGSHWFVPADLGAEGEGYFTWMMIFSGLFPLVGALSAFFIGRKQVRVVVLSVIMGNIVNLVLAIIFVFGIPGLIPNMGAKGAAIATGIAETSVAVVLLIIFLNRQHRQQYHTHHYRLNGKLIWQCFKLGFPNAIGHMCATAAWAYVLYLLIDTTADHLTVMSIGLTIWMLFSFITDSLQKAVSAISANYLGSGKHNALSVVLMMGLALQAIFALVLVIPLVLVPKLFATFFIPLHGLSPQETAHLIELIEMTCRCLWLAYVFDGMAWVVDGLLTAIGDTTFIMFTNSIGTWLLFIGPMYFWIVKGGGTPLLSLQLMIGFCVALFVNYYVRYRTLMSNRQFTALITQS